MRVCSAILCLMVLFAAGCGPEKLPDAAAPPSAGGPPERSAEKPSEEGSAAAIAIADLDGISKAGKPYRLALVVKTRNNPFFDPMIKAFEQEARLLGAVPEVQAPEQETDKEKQFSMVENVVAKGVDAILIAPADSRAIVPALKKAQQKGILVINVDNRVDPTESRTQDLRLGGYVGADNQAGGMLAGKALVQALGGKGKVALLEGIRGADNAEARKRGFEQAVAGKLEIIARDTAEWETARAYAKFQSMLAANPDIQGLFCANDKMALGAIKAIQEAGKKGKIAVVGYDNIADVKPYLESGEMVATIEQRPDLMGKYGARLAIGVLDGVIKPGGEFLVPLQVIKKEP